MFKFISTIRICPKCKGTVRRKIGGGTGLIFKGSGYYLTDYAKKNSSPQSNTPVKKESKKEKTKGKDD